MRNLSIAYEKWHKHAFSVFAVVVFAALTWVAFAVGLGQGGGAAFARKLAWTIVLATMVWMIWVIWNRNSKARWLSVAIILEWGGVGMLYLPSVELHKTNGLCIPALEVGKSLGWLDFSLVDSQNLARVWRLADQEGARRVA